jgi:Rubisco LSMT substrate-binding
MLYTVLTLVRCIHVVYCTEQITDNNELSVLTLLQSACETALAGYPTTEEQDTAIMSDRGMFGALSKVQRMAVKVCIHHAITMHMHSVCTPCKQCLALHLHISRYALHNCCTRTCVLCVL